MALHSLQNRTLALSFKLGRGTTFEVNLPRVDEPAKVLDEKIEKEEAPCDSETILIVEGEEAVRKLTARFIKKAGLHSL